MILVIVAVLIQGILPFLGHAAIVKTLRLLVIPFVVLFAIMLGFAIPHANLHVVKTSGDWQAFMEALAFTIALSGLGWTENGNDYTALLPDGHLEEGDRGLGLPGDCRARDPHHDPRRASWAPLC